jgi:DNA-binding transcriptional ArsR family regulator
MAKYKDALGVVAFPTRLKILKFLLENPDSPCATVAEGIGEDSQNVHAHLKTLEKANLVTSKGSMLQKRLKIVSVYRVNKDEILKVLTPAVSEVVDFLNMLENM